MGKYDHLIPGNTATAEKPVSSTNKYSHLIPAAQSAPTQQMTIRDVGKFFLPQEPKYALSMYDQAQMKQKKSPFLLENLRAQIGGAVQGWQNTPTVPKTTNFMEGIGNHNALTQAKKVFTEGVENVGSQIYTARDTSMPITDRNVALGRAVTGTLSTAMGTVFAPFETYASVPIVGHVLDAVNKTLGAIGGAGSASFGQAFDRLPIDEKTKEKVRPLVEELGALSAQLVAGKVGGDAFSEAKIRLSDNTKAIMRELQNDPVIKSAIQEEVQRSQKGEVKVPVSSESTPGPVKINTPKTKHQEYAKSQGYEPYTPPDELPVIEMGKKPKGEPTIEIGSRSPRQEFKYSPLPDNSPLRAAPSDTRPATPSTPATPAVTVPDRPVINGERVTKAAHDLNVSFVEKGFAALSFDEQAKYSPITKSQQLRRIADLISSDLAAAKRMAAGHEPVPEGIHPQILFNALESYAMENGDFGLMRDLAASPIATQLSEAGQTLSAHGMNDNPNSPVRVIRDISKAREARAERQSKGTIKKERQETVHSIEKEISKEIKENSGKRVTWDEFINKLTCEV